MRPLAPLILMLLLPVAAVATEPEPESDPVREILLAAVDTFHQGGHTAAIAAVESLAVAHPDDVRTHSVLGQLCWYDERRDEARAAFKRVLEMDPHHADAITHLKRLDFVPADFRPPHLLITDDFVLRPITASDAESDYQAIMASAERLQGFFPGLDWPAGLTLEENLEVLAWHEEEFADRTGFVYTVRSRWGDRCEGCVYIYPSRRTGVHADALMWVTTEAAGRGKDEKLEHDIRFWLETDWPFTTVAYPGRSVSWARHLDDSAG